MDEEIKIPKFIGDLEVVSVSYAALKKAGIYEQEDFSIKDLLAMTEEK